MNYWVSLIIVLLILGVFAGSKAKQYIPQMMDGEITSVQLWTKCPKRNGSYRQCTNNGSYRHSDFDIELNHKLYKNNPRVNIWRVEEI